MMVVDTSPSGRTRELVSMSLFDALVESTQVAFCYVTHEHMRISFQSRGFRDLLDELATEKGPAACANLFADTFRPAIQHGRVSGEITDWFENRVLNFFLVPVKEPHEMEPRGWLCVFKDMPMNGSQETGKKLAERINGLTPREHQVLGHVVDGKPNKVTARVLDISLRTVEKHRANLMKKLNVQNTAELVRFVVINENALKRQNTGYPTTPEN